MKQQNCGVIHIDLKDVFIVNNRRWKILIKQKI